MNWIHEEIMPQEWTVDGHNPPRGPYAPEEAEAVSAWVSARAPEYGQALHFILSSGARIDETLHLRADKIFLVEKRVELFGKGSRMRKIQVLHANVLKMLNLSRRFVYLTEQPGRLWKDGVERRVRQACEALDIRRRGVHGFWATAACEFVNIKSALGYIDMEARQELATCAPHRQARPRRNAADRANRLRCSAGVWLGHNPHRIEVTYAYVPRVKSIADT